MELLAILTFTFFAGALISSLVVLNKSEASTEEIFFIMNSISSHLAKKTAALTDNIPKKDILQYIEDINKETKFLFQEYNKVPFLKHMAALALWQDPMKLYHQDIQNLVAKAQKQG